MAWQQNPTSGVYYNMETGQVSQPGNPPPGFVPPPAQGSYEQLMAAVAPQLVSGGEGGDYMNSGGTGTWQGPSGTVYNIIGSRVFNFNPGQAGYVNPADAPILSRSGLYQTTAQDASDAMNPDAPGNGNGGGGLTGKGGAFSDPAFWGGLAFVAGGAAGAGAFSGAGEGALSAAEFAANAGVGAPGAMGVGEGALSAAEFGANAGVGANPSIPSWMQPSAGGVADTGFGANTVPSFYDTGTPNLLDTTATTNTNLSTVTAPPDGGNVNFLDSLIDPWGAGVADPALSVGDLTVPSVSGNVIDSVAPTLTDGDMFLTGGAGGVGGSIAAPAVSPGIISSIANALGISESAAGRLLGGAGGALLGSVNGARPAGTTTTTTDIPDWLKPYATSILDKGKTLTNAAPTDFSQSDTLLKNVMAGTANPYSQQDNPYFEKTLNLALNDTQGRVNNQFRNSAFGGSANQELLSRNLGDQSNNLRFGQYKNAQDLYQQDLGRATNVATGMPQYSAQKTQSNFQPLLNQKSLLGFGGSQTSSPYFTNPTSGALYGGLLGSQLFGGK